MARKPTYDLAKIVRKINHRNTHDEIEVGFAVGAEFSWNASDLDVDKHRRKHADKRKT